MDMRTFGAVGALVFGLSGCASGGPPQTATAPGADIAAYASFAWLPASDSAEGTNERPLSIADANLYGAIRKQLVEKGYHEVEVNPDFRIAFETATQMREKASNPVQIGIGMGSWSGNFGSAVSTSLPVGSERVTTIPETRITIRAVDRKSNQEVWVGSTTGEIQEGLDANVLERTVADLMDGFPVRRR